MEPKTIRMKPKTHHVVKVNGIRVSLTNDSKFTKVIVLGCWVPTAEERKGGMR